MSIRSLTALAAQRDKTPRNADVDGETPWNAVITAIPSEILALYTALTGALLPLVIDSNRTAYLPLRWGVLAFAVACTPLVVNALQRRKSTVKRWPIAEMAAATLAAAAWFLTMPGSPLTATLTDSIAAVTCGFIVLGTGLLLQYGFGRKWLSKGAGEAV